MMLRRNTFFLVLCIGCFTLPGCCLAEDTDRAKRSLDVDCHASLGVSSPGVIPLYWMHASDGLPFRGRLNAKRAWLSNKYTYFKGANRYQYSWIQVDLHHDMVVSGIQTQGDPQDDNWVTNFSILHSSDCEKYTALMDIEGGVNSFHANVDRNTVVTNIFDNPLVARCVRVIPLDREGNITALRMELLGCDVGVCREAIVQHMPSENPPGMIPVVINSSATTDERLLQRNESPTLVTSAFDEFKFLTEHILFGIVFYKASVEWKKGQRKFIVTYSRNCRTWEPIRDRQGFGDAKNNYVIYSGYTNAEELFQVFKPSPAQRSSLEHFPYAIRAQCIRVIPYTQKSRAQKSSVSAHFIGCPTGQSVIQQCGLRKRLRHKRVVGGSVADPNEWPWLVAMEVKHLGDTLYQQGCGATLIHPDYLLTAAHCIIVMHSRASGELSYNASDWNTPILLDNLRVRMGEHSLLLPEGTQFEAEIEDIITHPEYGISRYINDIAIMKLKKTVRLTDHLNTICIPEEGYFGPGSMCQVMGWGKTERGSPYRPLAGPVPIVDFNACQKMYHHVNLTADMMCAAPEDASVDACVGDSGGPLVCEKDGQWFQAGVVSWNIGCGVQGYPGVYANVSHFASWINDVISGGHS